MKTKIILTFVLSAIAFGYVPIPAPVPMGNFVVYQGQTVNGDFTIEDPNGPVGLIITSTPAGLTISDPVITTISGYPDARRYVYQWGYTPTSTGTKTFDIKATDTLNVLVTQQIKFTVQGNAPHVFTGCRMLGN